MPNMSVKSNQKNEYPNCERPSVRCTATFCPSPKLKRACKVNTHNFTAQKRRWNFSRNFQPETESLSKRKNRCGTSFSGCVEPVGLKPTRIPTPNWLPHERPFTYQLRNRVPDTVRDVIAVGTKIRSRDGVCWSESIEPNTGDPRL